MVRELKDGRIEECVFKEVETTSVVDYEAHTTDTRSILIKFSDGASISFVIDDIIDFDNVKDFIYGFLSPKNRYVKEMTLEDCNKFLKEGINNLTGYGK